MDLFWAMFGPRQKKSWDSVLKHLALPMKAEGADVVTQNVHAAFVHVTLGFANPVFMDRMTEVLEHSPGIGKVQLITLKPPAGKCFSMLLIILVD